MVALSDFEAVVPLAFGAIVLMQILPTAVYVSTYLQMLISASATVFIGCVRSAKQDKAETEKMTSKDAYMFPVIGSCVLFGLYILIKFLDKRYLNILLGLYFFGIGVVVTMQTMSPFLAALLPKSMSEHAPYTLVYQLPGTTSEDYKIDISVTQVDIIGACHGVVLGGFYLQTKHWVLNNIFGVMFSIQGIEMISVGSTKIGVILLIGLFFYDIFWVFGTEVMVTVATGFKAPIKLQFPKNLHLPEEEPKFSIIGLGDLVIPGIYVALMLRFDKLRDASKMVYFPYCMSGYVGGLVATIAVMHFFQAAQPALLYLVPACLGTTLIPALMRGEQKELLEYSEEEEEEETKDGETKTAEDKKEE